MCYVKRGKLDNLSECSDGAWALSEEDRDCEFLGTGGFAKGKCQKTRFSCGGNQ